MLNRDWVQHGPVIRRHIPVCSVMSPVTATTNVKRGEVTVGEDMVNCGLGWSGKDVTACLGEQVSIRRKTGSVPQRRYTRGPKEAVS